MDNDTRLYQELQNDEIRLLRIISVANNTIQIELQAVSMRTNPEYTAISYEWGGPDVEQPSSRILLNSREIRTTLNLRIALHYLSKNALLWIDALCINQDDDAERGHQVRLMTQIYRQAHSVTIWLGHEYLQAFHHSLAMELINRSEKMWDDLPLENSKWIRWLRMELSMFPADRLWDMTYMLECSYWDRLWIIQEIVVASSPQSVQLLCGNQKASFLAFTRLLNGILALVPSTVSYPSISPVTLKRFHEQTTRVLQLHHHARLWRERRREEHGIELLRLLQEYHEQKCSDPRDKVYALLGVSAQYPSIELDVNYTIPVSEVYKNTVKYIIQGSQSLDVLSSCAKSPNTKSTLLPSWVPDWETYDKSNQIILSQDWNSCPGHKLSILSPRFSDDGIVLTAKAIVLGTILDCYEDNDMAAPRSVDPALFKTCLHDEMTKFIKWLSFAIMTTDGMTGQSPPRQSTLVAFYEALLCTLYGRERADSKIPLEKFILFCLLCLGKGNIEQTPYWILDTATLFSALDNPRSLCSVAINTSQSLTGLNLELHDVQLVPHKNSGNKLGISSSRVEKGDMVMVIPGCRHPLVLRKCGEHYILIDEIYVNGHMNGEDVGNFPEISVDLK